MSLKNLGLKNAFELNNFKSLIPESLDNIKTNNADCVTLCTFSRVSEDKGILDAIQAVARANDVLGNEENRIFLDIYGPIAKDFKDKLDSFLEKNDVAKYKGVVDYNNSAFVLKNYFCLLFPTYYIGEGVAGTIVDASFAGIPIIATDWNMNKESIVDGYNGFLVPVKDPNKIAESIIYLYNNRDEHYKMCVNSLKLSEKFNPKNVLQKVFDFIESD